MVGWQAASSKARVAVIISFIPVTSDYTTSIRPEKTATAKTQHCQPTNRTYGHLLVIGFRFAANSIQFLRCYTINH